MPKFAELATLTRREIKAFDREARELVHDFHSAGWRSYLSQNGHAILYAPDGESTASVSGHSDGPHKSKAARADLERWLRRNGKPTTAPTRRKHKPLRRKSQVNYPKPTPTPTPEHDNQLESPIMATRYGCPDCPERDPFNTPGALKLHRQQAHDGLQCSECSEAFKGKGKTERYRTHRLEAHGIEPKSKKLGVQAVDGVYSCPWCGKPYTALTSMAGHSKSHRGEPRPEVPPVWPEATAKEYPCPVPGCDAVYPHKNGINGHMRAHKNKGDAVTLAAPAEVAAAPDSVPVTTTTLVASGASTDLDAWLQGQIPADLLANVLAVLAPPLVGEVERLRRQRDELAGEVERLRQDAENYEARMAILREAMNL